MDKLESRFVKYSNKIKNADIEMNDNEKLELYGLYKQATVGNCNIEKPSILKFTEYRKYNSWNDRIDMSKEDAMTLYIELVKMYLK